MIHSEILRQLIWNLSSQTLRSWREELQRQLRLQEMTKAAAKELALLEKIKAHLEDGRLAKTFDAVEDEEEEEWLKSTIF